MSDQELREFDERASGIATSLKPQAPYFASYDQALAFVREQIDLESPQVWSSVAWKLRRLQWRDAHPAAVRAGRAFGFTLQAAAGFLAGTLGTVAIVAVIRYFIIPAGQGLLELFDQYPSTAMIFGGLIGSWLFVREHRRDVLKRKSRP